MTEQETTDRLADLSPQTRALVEQIDAAQPLMKSDEFEVISEDLFYRRACTTMSDEDATTRVNLWPSGTSNGWTLCTAEGQAPVPCNDKPETHRHLMWEC